MLRLQQVLLGSLAYLSAVAVSNGTTIYTSDPNLADFTSSVTNYATFLSAVSSDVPLPYTPTAASLASGFRVIGNGSTPSIIASFSEAVSSIRVFPNIDHFGLAYDGYQYTVSGSNDGVTYTLLYNPTSTVGGGEPFTLGTFTGTAPYQVNNVLTPGAGPGGTVGYEADFSFSQAYQWYSFGSSVVGIDSGNSDQELSGVAALAPEPATLAGLISGGCLLALMGFRRRKPD